MAMGTSGFVHSAGVHPTSHFLEDHAWGSCFEAAVNTPIGPLSGSLWEASVRSASDCDHAVLKRTDSEVCGKVQLVAAD